MLEDTRHPLKTGAIRALSALVLTGALASCTAGPPDEPKGPAPDQASGASSSPPSSPPSTAAEPDAQTSDTTASPTTRPGTSEVVISPDGLVGLRFGEDPYSRPDLLVWSPQRCRLDPPIGEATGAWIPADARYFSAADYRPEAYFGSTDSDGRLDMIGLEGPTVATAEGIRVGSPLEEVLAAYPSAHEHDAGRSSVFVVPGSAGQLNIEVVDSGDDAEFAGKALVIWSSVTRTQTPPAVYATDGYGICPL